MTLPKKNCNIELSLIKASGLNQILKNQIRYRPLNIIGSQAAVTELRRSGFLPHHGAEPNYIFPSSILARTVERGAGLVGLVRVLTQSLWPRSSTLILDPELAGIMLEDSKSLNTLSLKTAGFVLLPLVTQASPFVSVYSDSFSFPEKDKNGKSSWIWKEYEGRAFCTIAHNGAEGEYAITFTFSAANPGVFSCRLGKSQLGPISVEGNFVRHFKFLCYLIAGPNVLEIEFDGQPVRPKTGLDDRRELFFCISDLTVKSAKPESSPAVKPSSFARRTDHTVRQLAHSVGFFEVNTVGCSHHDLAWQVGLRSCFDYRQEFRLRDYRRFNSPHNGASQKSRELLRCVWYWFSKTPHAGSEWGGYVPTGSNKSAILEEQPPSVDIAVQELVEVRGLLQERTGLLEQASKSLKERTQELIGVRELLQTRTSLLEDAGKILKERTQELVEVRGLLEKRTSLLEDAGKSLKERTQELVEVRGLLEKRNSLLEDAGKSLKERTQELVEVRGLLEKRTSLLEDAGKILKERTQELVEVRGLLEKRTSLLEDAGKSLKERTQELVEVRGLLETRTSLLEVMAKTLKEKTEQLEKSLNSLIDKEKEYQSLKNRLHETESKLEEEIRHTRFVQLQQNETLNSLIKFGKTVKIDFYINEKLLFISNPLLFKIYQGTFRKALLHLEELITHAQKSLHE